MTPSPHSTRRHWLALPLAVLFLALCLIVLQNVRPDAAGIFFVLLIMGLALIGLEASTQIGRRTMRSLQRALRHLTKPLWAQIVAHRERFAPLAAFGTLALFIVGAVLFENVSAGDDALIAPFLILLVGLALWGLAVFLNREAQAFPTSIHTIANSRRVNLILLSFGLIALGTMTEANANLLHIDLLYKMTTDGQFVLLCLGLTLITLGSGGVWFIPVIGRAVLRFLKPAVKKQPVPQPMRLRIEPFMPVGVVFLAFALRFWHLHDTNRLFFDELNHVGAVNDLFSNAYTALLAPFNKITAFPYIFPYGEKAAVEIFGRNYLGIRAFSAVIGTLTVAAVYRLGRALFDKRVGLIAALLLATFPPHLQFSRIGLNNIADPLFGTLALAFLAQGVRYNRRMDWALGGVMLGLTHYFYEAGRLVYTPLVIVWLAGLWLLNRVPYGARKKGAVKAPKWRFVRSAAISLIITAAPVYITLYGMNRSVAARFVTNQVGLNTDYWQSIFQPGHLQQHIVNHVIPAFSVYMTQPDETLFYGGDTPLLMTALAPFFLLGLACLLWRWRAPGALLLLLWLTFVSLGNSLVLQSAAYTRFVLVFPALMLIAAVGISYGLPMILRTQARRRWAVVLIAIVSIGIAAMQAYDYFGVHIPSVDYEMRSRLPYPDPEDAILRALNFPFGTGIHLISSVPADLNYYNAILQFMRPDLTLDTLSPDELTPKYFYGLRCGPDQAFFLQLDDWSTLLKLRSEYYLHQPQLSPYPDIPPQQQYILYYAPYWPGNDRPFPNRNHCSPLS